MVRTFGLTHVALAVADVARSSHFYMHVFGMVALYQRPGFVQLQTPGSHDAVVLEETGGATGPGGGIVHFGFRLRDPADLDAVVRAATEAGGRVRAQGEFCPGEPYAFLIDPDGYEVEVWYEPPALTPCP
jgi:catechol 2,3-dioxygenase-like lactoylglutathione lyase family enzyme